MSKPKMTGALAGVLLTAEEVCARWKGHVKPGTLANWRNKKMGPDYTKIGGAVFYDIEDIKKYERESRVKV